jgi:hypothetical protein|tara:strand:- start:222 stop:614 length:393 start_codon:yes stop_codon:yes gene_type:complete
MAVPIMRQYNHGTVAAPVALNTFAFAQDAITGLTIQQLNKDNSIIDYVNSPDPAVAADLYTSRLFLNNLESGPAFFSINSSAASAGRTVPGPLPIAVQNVGGKQVSYNVAQTAGAAAAAYSFIVKYANLF